MRHKRRAHNEHRQSSTHTTAQGFSKRLSRSLSRTESASRKHRRGIVSRTWPCHHAAQQESGITTAGTGRARTQAADGRAGLVPGSRGQPESVAHQGQRRVALRDPASVPLTRFVAASRKIRQAIRLHRHRGIRTGHARPRRRQLDLSPVCPNATRPGLPERV